MPEKYTEYVVERICDKKIKDGVVYYYIKWEGYPDEENSWEPVENCVSPLQTTLRSITRSCF